MLQPLISLWRHHARVTFYDALSSKDAAESDLSGLTFGSPIGVRRHFFHADEAMAYLRYWMGDPGAVSELRWLLHKTGPALSGARGGPEQWLQVLANRMQSGSLVAVEETAKRQFLGKMVVTSAASGLSSLTSLAVLPAFLTNDSADPIEDCKAGMLAFTPRYKLFAIAKGGAMAMCFVQTSMAVSHKASA